MAKVETKVRLIITLVTLTPIKILTTATTDITITKILELIKKDKAMIDVVLIHLNHPMIVWIETIGKEIVPQGELREEKETILLEINMQEGHDQEAMKRQKDNTEAIISKRTEVKDIRYLRITIETQTNTMMRKGIEIKSMETIEGEILKNTISMKMKGMLEDLIPSLLSELKKWINIYVLPTTSNLSIKLSTNLNIDQIINLTIKSIDGTVLIEEKSIRQ
jgi:hypothetical protein